MTTMNWWDYPVGRAHDPSDNANGGELGIDLSTPVGTPITTPWVATVTYVGNSSSTGWIVKAWTNVPGVGPVYEYFLHLKSVNVSVGQTLPAGTVVGLSDGTQPGAGGWAHVEFGLFTSSAYAHQYWGFVTGSTLDPTPVIQALRQGENAMGIPTGWKDDGTTLTAPNGIAVISGFRGWILGHSWDAGNVPLAHEQAITSGSIEPGNAAMGPGSRQDFRFSSLGWTTSTGVYVIAVGQDIVALERQLAAANAQVLTLAQQLAAAASDPALIAVKALAAALKALGS